MKFSNQVYDVLKYLVTIFSPALMTLIAGFGSAGMLDNATAYVTVIGLVTAFIGSLINVSSKQYKHREEE